MDNLHLKTDEEIEEHIKSQRRIEQEKRDQEKRLKQLTAKVEVEEIWESLNPTEEQQMNLNLWLEHHKNDYRSYLASIKDYRGVTIGYQMSESPDERNRRKKQEYLERQQKQIETEEIGYGSWVWTTVVIAVFIFVLWVCSQ